MITSTKIDSPPNDLVAFLYEYRLPMIVSGAGIGVICVMKLKRRKRNKKFR